MTPLLPMSAARVFFDGIFTDPRVAHPEGVAVHADGSIWCGNELGELLRIAADGSKVERMGSTDGFALGIAFDSAGNCFMCDLKHAAVFRYDAASRTIEKIRLLRHPRSELPDRRREARRSSTSPTAAAKAISGRAFFATTSRPAKAESGAARR